MPIDIPIVVPSDPLTATMPRALRVCLLAHAATMSVKVFGNLSQDHHQYKIYSVSEDQTMPQFSVIQVIYVDRPSLVILSLDQNAEKYN